MSRRSLASAATLVARVALPFAVCQVAPPARAQSPTFSLDWRAPSDCPSSDFVVQEVARLLGRAPGGPSDRPVATRADVVLGAGGLFRVRIALTTAEASGERTFEDPVCAHVATATALIVSLAIDPESAFRVPAHAAAPPAPTFPTRPPAPRAPARRSFRVGAETGVDIGILPVPGWRFAGVLGLSWRAFRYDVVGGYDLEQHVPAPGRPGQGARIQLATLKLRGCLVPVDRILEVDTCIAAEGGWFVATGEGITAPLTKAYPWGATLAGLKLVWHTSSLFEMKLQGEGGTALLRPVFDITGSNPGFVHQPSRFMGEGSVAVDVRFQ